MKSIPVLLLTACLLVVVLAPAAQGVSAQIDGFTVYLPVVARSVPSTPNVVVNGGFEAGSDGWKEYSSLVGYRVILQEDDLPPLITPYEGAWAAWLGGDSALITYIEQEITLPDSAPELVYWRWIDAPPDQACDSDSYGGAYLGVDPIDDDWLCAATDTGGWEKRAVDLSAYAGQTVSLRFFSRTGFENYSSLYIDAVSIQSSP